MKNKDQKKEEAEKRNKEWGLLTTAEKIKRLKSRNNDLLTEGFSKKQLAKLEKIK